MRLILTPVADRPESARALVSAFDLGHRLGASVKGMHVRPHRHSRVTLSPEFAQAAWRKKSSKKSPMQAKALFEQIAEERGYSLIKRARQEPGALWCEKVGDPEHVMGIEGPVSDLIVVSRPEKFGGVADLFMRAALFETARPLLLLPPSGRRNVGKNVVIAWNQSKEAVRAVAAALPMLALAESVTILSAGTDSYPGPKAQQLVSYLQHHGIKASRETTKGREVEKEILGAVREIKADLLVCGAYSRWRETLFGGTSEYLIYESTVPLLTIHR